jgi:hypothetical protein
VGTDGDRMAVAAANLRIDSFTAEIVTQLRGTGVRIVLLKGPGVARWLYDSAGERPYLDADLLVPPADLRRAERKLREMAFQPGEWRAWLRRAREWSRSDGTVDLHTSLFGITVAPQRAWEILSRTTETISVGGTEVQVLALPARALHVAIHVAQHPLSHGQAQARVDLERAIVRASWPTWQGAARLATELGAEAALCGGLRQVEGGTELAERLGVADADSAEVALSADDASSVALGFAELAAADSTRLRLSLAFRLILPPRSLMRTRLTLAGRAEESLAWAYLRHLARIGWSAPRGFLDWQRARR